MDKLFKHKTWLVLILVMVVAAVLRFYKLSEIPPSLEWDEVATGYDAYSILKTGRDQFGNFLPLSFRSIDDYKPPLYTYLTSVSIAVLGWNDFAVRFPAAFLGVMAVLTTYGMVSELFKNNKLALLTALLLAISPWHVNFSRLALETNSTIFFTTGGMWAFFKGLEKGKWLLIAVLMFGINLYLYHNSRVFIPLLAITLLFLFRKKLWQQKKYTLLSAVFSLIFVVPLVPIITSIQGQMRFQGLSIFGNYAPQEIAQAREEYAKRRLIDIQNGISIYGTMFHNQTVLYGLRVLRNYLTHFDANFFLFTNDYKRHHVPEMGIVYFIELPLILYGIYLLLNSQDKRLKIIIFAWILFAPIPASVTKDVPHALRSEVFLPTLQILAALALAKIWQGFSQQTVHKKSVAILIAGLFFLNISFFLHKFYYHYARETSKDWVYGRKEAALFAESVKADYERIIVSTNVDQPHVFFLYYLKYDPQKYLAEGGTVSGGWAEQGNKFDKYEFHQFDYPADRDGRTLFIGTPKDFPNENNLLKKIQYLDGTDAIWIVRG